MDEFVWPITDRARRESTNNSWNRLCLNSKWSVGCVSELIQSRKWRSKEEWEDFYYQSGAERLQLIGKDAAILNNFRMTKWQHEKQPDNFKQINYYHGRTRDELMEKAQVLYNAEKNNGYGLTLDECFECVRFRTICQTWNGIIVAESKCIELLSTKYPMFSFVKAEGDKDYDYGIDYEVLSDGKVVLGLQIKPYSYLYDSSYLRSAKAINASKFKAYKEQVGADVQIVIYNPRSDSYITNLGEIQTKLSMI